MVKLGICALLNIRIIDYKKLSHGIPVSHGIPIKCAKSIHTSNRVQGLKIVL